MKKILIVCAAILTLSAMAACKNGTSSETDTTRNEDTCQVGNDIFTGYDDHGITFCHGGYTWIRKGEKFGIIDSCGNILTPAIWDMVLVEEPDHNMLVELKGKTYIIDTNGNLTETDEKIDWSGESYG